MEADLVPVFLDTALSACRKSLVDYGLLVIDFGKSIHGGQEHVGQTLAISLQVLPESRMVLSLCSSSAVHGVFVLPFFFVPESGVAVTAAEFASPSIALVS